MIVLDTNVVSEVMSGLPSSPVLPWIAAHSGVDLRITVITAMEISYGLSRLPTGRKKDQLAAAWDTVVDSWAAKFLTIDLDTSRLAGEVQGLCSRAGRPIPLADALISATTLRHGASLATRNIKDFEGLGLTLVNPWQN